MTCRRKSDSLNLVAEGRNQRRHERYNYVTSATVIRGKRKTQLRTSDVSFSGMFLPTNEPPPLRELVKIQLDLPSDGAPIELLCMAVHRVPPGGPRPPGIGVLLYGLGPGLRARWESFVNEVRSGKHGTGPTQDLPWPEPEAPVAEPVYCPELRVRLPNPPALLTIRERDLERKRTFVRTDVFLEPGTKVTILYIHPESTRTFRIAATVQQQIKRPGIVGLAIHYDCVDARVLSDFDTFMEDDIHVTMDVEVDVDFDPFDGQ